MTKNIVKQIIIFTKKWFKVLIFYGLSLYAIYATAALAHFVKYKLISIYSLVEIISLFLLIMGFNYVLYIYFPKKYLCWNINYIIKLFNHTIGRIDEYKNNEASPIFKFLHTIIFYSPFSIAIKSIGLSIFILSFFDTKINFLWYNIKLQDSVVFEFIAKISIYPFFILLVMLVIALFLGLIKNIFNKDFSGYNILITVILIATIVMSINSNVLLQEISEYIMMVSMLLVKMIIGLIPVGWFYELFIKSVIKRRNHLKEKY